MEQNPIKPKVFDLEDRLVTFASRVIDVAEKLPKTMAAKHIAGQMVRCGTSPAFNYAEAQSAESSLDFIHKMKICLKELRETMVCSKLILKRQYFSNDKLASLMQENHELIAIFVKSVATSKKKAEKKV